MNTRYTNYPKLLNSFRKDEEFLIEEGLRMAEEGGLEVSLPQVGEGINTIALILLASEIHPIRTENYLNKKYELGIASPFSEA